MGALQPLQEIEDEARRLLQQIASRGLPLRLIGGMAIRERVGEQVAEQIPRPPIADLDFVTAPRMRGPVSAFFVEQGYAEAERFNAVNGRDRLLFHDEIHGRQVDVFVGSFEMCHALPVAERLLLEPVTLPNAELLLTKLQVVELTEKDRVDVLRLLVAFEVGPGDGDSINMTRIAEICASDWGLWRTFTGNLRMVSEAAHAALEGSHAALVRDRARKLLEAIEAAPKSRRWRLRARVGERKRWYELPEEVRR